MVVPARLPTAYRRGGSASSRPVGTASSRPVGTASSRHGGTVSSRQHVPTAASAP
jgi:hypothetical protein